MKEVIADKDRCFGETGYCFGLKKLKLLEDNSAKFDRSQWRLLSAAYCARESSKLVSASPAAIGMGELLNLIALPEGDVIVSSFGLMGHVADSGAAITPGAVPTHSATPIPMVFLSLPEDLLNSMNIK